MMGQITPITKQEKQRIRRRQIIRVVMNLIDRGAANIYRWRISHLPWTFGANAARCVSGILRRGTGAI